MALNFEARGTSGPPIMFETSRGNAGLAGVFAAAAPHPVATSFAVEVYRALPNDTDFSVLLADGGFTGLNTAYIDGAAAYHTPQDRPERMDRASLQAMGDNALALARALGNRDLGAAGEAQRRRRHLLPGARPAGPLPGQPGLAAGRRGAARRSPSWLLVPAPARASARCAGRRARTALALLPIVAGAAGRAGAVVAAGR